MTVLLWTKCKIGQHLLFKSLSTVFVSHHHSLPRAVCWKKKKKLNNERPSCFIKLRSDSPVLCAIFHNAVPRMPHLGTVNTAFPIDHPNSHHRSIHQMLLVVLGPFRHSSHSLVAVMQQRMRYARAGILHRTEYRCADPVAINGDLPLAPFTMLLFCTRTCWCIKSHKLTCTHEHRHHLCSSGIALFSTSQCHNSCHW